MATCVCIAASSWGYSIFGLAFINCPTDYQWILGLILPLIRELNGWVVQKLAYQSAAGDSSGVKIICVQAVIVYHSMFLAYTVGNNATNAIHM